jgi:H+/Cl- antiporter ClcA
MPSSSPQPNLFASGGAAALSPRFWLLLPLVGVGGGFGGGVLMLLLRTTQHLAWSYRSGSFLAAVQQTGALHRVAVLATAGLVVGLYRWLTASGPGGHGGELAEAIWFRSGRVPLLSATFRAVLSIVVVGLGASLGREAAPKQFGAAVASALAGWLDLSPPERRLLAACGAGAGIAAVYNVPLGAGLFALEVLLGVLALPFVLPAIAASVIGTGVSWLLLPDVPTFSVPPYRISAAATVWAVLAGPLLGLAAAGYVRLIAWADARKPEGWPRLIAPVVVFLTLGVAAIALPQLLGNGKDVVQQAFLGRLGLPLLLVLMALKPVATAACLGSGAPGGLFMPTLSVGALLGGVLGALWTSLWPGAPIGSYAIIGAGAMLGASTAGPLSALVLIAELMHRVDTLMVPLMLAVGGAVLVARLVEPRSIYSARIHSGRARARERTPPRTTGFDDLVSDRYGVVSAAAPLVELLGEMAQLGGDGARPVFVVDETGRLAGAISPEQLSRRAESPLLLETATAGDLAKPVTPVPSTADRAAILARLEGGNDAALPVVDAATGRPVGLAKRGGR